MRMAEKQVADVAIGAHDFGKGLLLGQADVVETGEVQVERRVMHEQVNRFVLMFCQGGLQPIAALLAVNATVGAVLDGIDHDEHARRGWHRVLHETVIIDLRLRVALQVSLAVVVITDEEMTGHVQPGDLLDDEPVGGFFATVGEITGDHTAFSVTMMAANVIDTAAEAFSRVEAV